MQPPNRAVTSQAPSLHNLHQFGVAVDEIVLHRIRGDFGKEFAGTIDFDVFDGTKFHPRHRSLGFSNKVHVLHVDLFENYGPIRVVVAHWVGIKKVLGSFAYASTSGFENKRLGLFLPQNGGGQVNRRYQSSIASLSTSKIPNSRQLTDFSGDLKVFGNTADVSDVALELLNIEGGAVFVVIGHGQPVASLRRGRSRGSVRLASPYSIYPGRNFGGNRERREESARRGGERGRSRTRS